MDMMCHIMMPETIGCSQYQQKNVVRTVAIRTVAVRTDGVRADGVQADGVQNYKLSLSVL